MRSGVWALAAAAAGLALLSSPARADEEDGPSILDSLPALAPLKSGRDALVDQGFRISGFYFADPRANLHGGMREGSTYSGLLKVGLDVDFEKVFGIEGGRLHADVLQIHGKDVSERYVGNLMSANDIGARPGTRLFEFYWAQEIGERVELKFGQLAADEEYLKSEYAEVFIGASLGWAASPSENLPQEGPAYPLAALGAQARIDVTENFTLIGAIYNGTTANPDALDPQANNPHGLNFRLKDPPLVILESRTKFDGLFGLPGMIKLGGYAHFGDFEDLKRGTDGRILGSPGSNDEPREHDGNYNLYAVLDQQIWRAPGDDPERGIGVFGRVIWGPKDRNEINAYFDGGIVAKGLVPGRPDDVAGLAFAYAGFSPRLKAVDRAEGPGAVHTREAMIEATYKAQIVPGLTVAPTFQYVMRPNGGPPEDGGPRIPNATIFGVTTIVTF